MIGALFVGAVILESIIVMTEIKERHQIYAQARSYADSLGKPLLVIGSPKVRSMHGCGDVTIDSDPNVLTYCDFEIGDIRDIPYPDGYFGAAFVSHVLEHLPTVEDAFKALDELERVSDRVFTVSPHKTSILALINTDHHLWVTPSGDGYIIEQRGQGAPKEESYVISMEVV